MPVKQNVQQGSANVTPKDSFVQVPVDAQLKTVITMLNTED